MRDATVTTQLWLPTVTEVLPNIPRAEPEMVIETDPACNKTNVVNSESDDASKNKDERTVGKPEGDVTESIVTAGIFTFIDSTPSLNDASGELQHNAIYETKTEKHHLIDGT